MRGFATKKPNIREITQNPNLIKRNNGRHKVVRVEKVEILSRMVKDGKIVALIRIKVTLNSHNCKPKFSPNKLNLVIYLMGKI